MEETLFTDGELHEDCNSGGSRGRPCYKFFLYQFPCVAFLIHDRPTHTLTHVHVHTRVHTQPDGSWSQTEWEL